MGHVSFSDDVSLYGQPNPARQQSASRSLQPCESIGIILRHPSPPELRRPSVIPSIRQTQPNMPPHTTLGAPPLCRPNVSMMSGSLSAFPLQQSPSPRVFNPNPPSRLTPQSYTSVEEPFHFNTTPLLNRIVSIFKDICYGHVDCIGYEVLVLPSSLLLEDEMALYKAFPATDPPLPLLMIEAVDLPVALKVRAGDAGFATVWDVLDTIYQHRSYLGDKQFGGLSTTTDRLSLQLHLWDND